MKAIKITKGKTYPTILLDKENNRFEIAGLSYTEDSGAFYKPVLEWFDSYVANPNDKTLLVFKMEYYNKPASKVFFTILRKLETLHAQDKEVEVNWHYGDDEDMLENGKEFAEIVKIPFRFIEAM